MNEYFLSQLNNLKVQFESEKMSHAYLISGPIGIGKKEFITQLLLELNKLESQDELLSSSDFFQLAPEIEEKKDKIRKKKISIEQIKELIPKLYYYPNHFSYKFLLIDELESMTNAGSNALLKLIEEPPEKTIIFAITHNETRLLATIRSRFQVIRLLSDKKAVHGSAEECRPKLTVRMSDGSNSFDKMKNYKERFRTALKSSFADQSTLASDLGADPDKELIFDEWLFYLRGLLLNQIESGKDIRIIYKINVIIEELLKLKGDLQSSNVNARLRIEQFFLSL